jgi:hypothetical protein
MKDKLKLLQEFTEDQWKLAKKEMNKRIPSMRIHEMTMKEFKDLSLFLMGPHFEKIKGSKRLH